MIHFNEKHGMSNTPEYYAWAGAKGRCRNENDPAFPNYGGRNIAFDSRWDEFEAFFADMGPRPTPDHSLDRIDVDGPYSPENCRWATWTEQQRNRRSNRMVQAHGKTQCLQAWAEELGIHKATLKARLNRLPVDEALFGNFYKRPNCKPRGPRRKAA